MKNSLLIALISLLLVCPDLARAQSLPRMGGVRSNDMYGFGGSGSVYGFRSQRRNLTGVGNQKLMLTWRSFVSNTIFGVGRLSRAYSSGIGRGGFGGRSNSRRFF